MSDVHQDNNENISLLIDIYIKAIIYNTSNKKKLSLCPNFCVFAFVFQAINFKPCIRGEVQPTM